jgi:hypothetical protein
MVYVTIYQEMLLEVVGCRLKPAVRGNCIDSLHDTDELRDRREGTWIYFLSREI